MELLKKVKTLKRFKIEKIENDLYFIWLGNYTSTTETKKDIFKKIIELIKLNLE